MESIKSWHTDIQDWTKLTKDTVNFCLSQAELSLKSSIEASDRISTRAFSILTVVIPIITLSIGYLFKQITEHNADNYILSLAIFCLFFCFMSLFFLIRIIFPRNWMSLGGQPKEIFTSNMLDNDFEPELKFIAIVMGEIQAIQLKIDFNRASNYKRLNYLKAVIWILSITFLIASVFEVRQLFFFI